MVSILQFNDIILISNINYTSETAASNDSMEGATNLEPIDVDECIFVFFFSFGIELTEC